MRMRMKPTISVQEYIDMFNLTESQNTIRSLLKELDVRYPGLLIQAQPRAKIFICSKVLLEIAPEFSLHQRVQALEERLDTAGI